MAKLPENPKDIALLIWQALEREQGGPRPYLGMSEIGKECDRQLWYSFRHAALKKFPGRVLALFGRGHREEPQITDKLRKIGIRVVENDPETGKQFEFIGYKGHVQGHMDGAGTNFPEAPKTWAVLEFKTHSDKSFQEVRKQGVAKAKTEHFAQMQLYMGHSGMERALYVAVNKNDDDIYTEWLHFDKEFFGRMEDRARRIIDATEPPTRCSDDPSWFICKFCDYHGICHGGDIPQANCRTCARSTPVEGGKWECSQHGEAKSVCGDHLYIPALLGVPLDGDDEWVEYEGFVNATTDAAEGNAFEGKVVHTSAQLAQAGNVEIAKDQNFAEIRNALS